MNNKYSTVYDCTIVELPRTSSKSGSLTAVHSGVNLPFEIARVFYLYDIPGGVNRGAHAHKECHQFLVAAGGSFEVEVSDGVNRRTFALNRPYYGLHIPPGIWISLNNFSSGAICLVLASHIYEEADYVCNYEIFKSVKSGKGAL